MTDPVVGIPWLVWAGLCLVVASIYVVLWPRPRRLVGHLAGLRWRHIVLRWCHALVWLLLALSCAVRSIQPSSLTTLANPLALLALLLYLIFLGTLALDRAASR